MKNFFMARMTTPTQFSWFHLLAIFITIALCVLVVLKCKNSDDKKDRIVLLTFSITAILLEVYKQLLFTADSGHYQWYAFPFQFCSTPMYVALLAAIFQNKKIASYLHAYLSTYGFLAGLLVMVMPGDVFMSFVGINIQTMFVHGGMVVIGIYSMVSGRIEHTLFGYVKAVIVFSVVVLIADMLNIIVYNIGVLNGATFNMFFISPYFNSTLPVFSSIQPSVPYILYLLIYILSFSVGGFIMFLPRYLLQKFKKN